MKKRFVLGFLIVLDYFIGIYLGYQRSILVGLLQGVCLGLLVWGRMEDLSLKNLKLDAFSAVRLVITLVLLVVAHLIAWRWGNYNSFLPYWPLMGMIAGMNLPGIFLRGAYGKGAYKKR